MGELTVLVAFWAIIGALVLTRIGGSGLRTYQHTVGIERTAMVNNTDYEFLYQIINNLRKSAAFRREPDLWQTNDTPRVFLASDQKGDVRLWVQVEAAMPHIALDSKKNNFMNRNLKATKLPPEKIQLEGNFPDYFDLYCDHSSRIIALQVISPDIMAELIDRHAKYDIEIIDNEVAILARGAALTPGRIKFAIAHARKLAKIIKAVEKVKHT